MYEHLDSNAVLTLVLGLPIEEQVALRHLLKKYNPRIDDDYNQVQALSKKRYKVVPSNGAPVQTGEATFDDKLSYKVSCLLARLTAVFEKGVHHA